MSVQGHTERGDVASPSDSKRVTVVGAGVIGLTTAVELARDGHDVTVVADVDTMQTVSSVSAALWFPYRAERSPVVRDLLRTSFERFAALSEVADSGVEMRAGTVVERSAAPDRSWTEFVPSAAEADPFLLPAGATSGIRATLPFIVIPAYLPWLRAQASVLGVAFEHRTVQHLGELAGHADAAVIAAGIRGGELLGGDADVVPVRGQVVRVANPGLTDWITDTDDPERVTYVFPRRDDVVVGGTSIDGSWDLEVDVDTERAILERAAALVPAIAGSPVVGRAVGLRPARPSIRLEPVAGRELPVIAAYGHGGAGVTLSWGTAERVRAMLRNDGR
ncbi:ABC transporter substrate-binding protein [Agromyces aureus]|uniref:D-amino-acid oxidase n=2 Tax=Agromyces aureus TaxID=453304 RepID=A0A191WJY1_9MICO|nr:ABC transporter substrate-binding protein [Agromyces aureus]